MVRSIVLQGGLSLDQFGSHSPPVSRRSRGMSVQQVSTLRQLKDLSHSTD